MLEYKNLESRQKSALSGVREIVNDNFLCAAFDVGRYGSLLYGISQVVGENPDMANAMLGGVVYLVCSFWYGLGNQKKSKEVAVDVAIAQIKDLEEIISTKLGGKIK